MQKSLRLAKKSGWWYRRNDDHTGSAGLYCQKGNEDYCYFPLFGTGKSSSGPARTLQKKVERCQHRLDQDRPKLEAAKRLVKTADRIIQVAESLMHEASLKDRMDSAFAEAEALEAMTLPSHMVDLAESNMSAALDLLDGAMVIEQELQLVRAEVEAVYAKHPQMPTTAGGQVKEAERAIVEAEGALDDVEGRETRSQLAALRSKITTLRGRISVIRVQIAQQDNV